MSKKQYPPAGTKSVSNKSSRTIEQQTEQEALAEDEGAFSEPAKTVMKVPHALVPAVRELIAKHHSATGKPR